MRDRKGDKGAEGETGARVVVGSGEEAVMSTTGSSVESEGGSIRRLRRVHDENSLNGLRIVLVVRVGETLNNCVKEVRKSEWQD